MTLSPNASECFGVAALEGLAEAERARLARWTAHLAARGARVPGEEDFCAFGKLSTLERLRAVLGSVAPEQCGPLRRVIGELRRAKRAGRSNGTGNPRGPDLRLAIPREDLRADWHATLYDMRDRAKRLDAGLLLLSGPTPPASSMIGDIEYVLRAVSKVCIEAGRSPALDKPAILAWLAREDARGRRGTGLSLQARLIARFLAYRGEKKKLVARLEDLASDYARRGRKLRKRKFQWMDQHGTTIGEVWDIAEALREKSVQAPPGTARRYRLALHAAVIALSVNMPLRIGDLHRLRIGHDICRSNTGWSVATRLSKTDSEYDLPALWPETTPFLDALLTLDAVGGALWPEYDHRCGTPLFSETRGATALTADWISDVFYEHVGTGQHIMRTIWHQLAYESDRDLTWMSLALCGQLGARTKREYRERNARGRTVRAGRQSLAGRRKQALLDARLADCKTRDQSPGGTP
jgi:hypothetical protein